MSQNILALAFALWLPISATTAPSARADWPPLVKLAPEQVFIPSGFDTNDRIEVVVAGHMPNTCYRLGPTHARVDLAAHRVLVEASAYIYPDTVCAEVMVPYSRTIDVGVVPSAGPYQVFADSRDGTVRVAGMLPVAPATSPRVDSLHYAAVSDTHLMRGKTLAIEGRLLNTCMSIQEVKTIYRSPGVVEVLPIVRMASSPLCMPADRPFQTRIAVHANGSGRNLIHVRSMNGQSVNLVTDF